MTQTVWNWLKIANKRGDKEKVKKLWLLFDYLKGDIPYAKKFKKELISFVKSLKLTDEVVKILKEVDN